MLLFPFNIRTLLPMLSVCATFLLFAPSVSACLCAGGSQKGVFEQTKKKATVIFVGRAVEVVNGIAHGEFTGWRVKLKVERYWKGQFKEEVILYTGPNDCAAHFTVGDEYLVLAYVPDGKDHLYTDICMQTGLVRYSAANLKRLGKSKRSP